MILRETRVFDSWSDASSLTGGKMFSQFFILTEHGDTLIFRDYRNDIVRGTAEIFFRRIESFKDETPPPVFMVESIHFLYVLKHGLYFVFDTKFNVSPTFGLELLDRISNLCKDCCGVLNEEAIRCNFTLIYELLDEVLDFGYPQTTTTENLKSYIFSKARIVEQMEDLTWQATGATVFGADKLTLPSTASNRPILSSRDKWVKKNEVFLDLLERLTVVFSASGSVARSQIDGCIQIKSFLAGNPVIRVGLNEDLSLGKPEGSQYRGLRMDDFILHESVNADEFRKSRTLVIEPPDGEFIAVSYRICGDLPGALPFRIHPQMEENKESRMIDLSIKLLCDIHEGMNASNVTMVIPVPKSTSSCSFQVSSGPQTIEHKASENIVCWTIKKVPGGAKHFARIKIQLSSISKASKLEVGPASLDFEIPMFNCSNMQIKFLKVHEKNGLYSPSRWVRHITHSDSYVQRFY